MGKGDGKGYGYGRMAIGHGYGRMEEHVELLQYLLYIFNTIFFMAGAFIFAVTLWTRFNIDITEYVTGLGLYNYWNGTYVIMVSAALVMLNAFMACCSAFFRSRTLIIACAGASVFALGLWTRFDKEMDEYVTSLGMHFYWHGTTVVMVGATTVMITAFLACCGAFFMSRLLIIWYKVFTVISFLMLLGGSAYILDHGLEGSKLYPWVQLRVRELIHQYQWDVSARRIVDILQEYAGCCGGFSSSDYTDIHVPIPNTCRDQVTGNQHGDSCAEIFSQYMEVRTAWITGLSLSLCFLQFFAMMFAVCMWKALQEMKADRR